MLTETELKIGDLVKLVSEKYGYSFTGRVIEYENGLFVQKTNCYHFGGYKLEMFNWDDIIILGG